MRKLTKEENDTYTKIIRSGNMDDMFDFAYTLGVIDTLKERIELLSATNTPNKDM